MVIDNAAIKVTVSIGVSGTTGYGDTNIRDTVKAADRALYRAKTAVGTAS